MNIPIDFVKDINPNLTDPLSKSTVYTFVPGSHICNDDRELLFRFPYSENTYWTHFKYATSLPNTVLEVELLIVTDDGQECVILPLHVRSPSTWNDTIWPLPSVDTSISAIYLKIKPPPTSVDIIVHLSGFVDLLPTIEQYVIMPGVNTPLIQLAISRANNTIYRLENYEPNSPNTLLVAPLLPNYK
jgi:hypothetical protein